MTKLKRLLFISALAGLFGFAWPFSTPNTANFGSNLWLTKEIQILKNQAGNIDEKVLRLSLLAYLNAQKNGISHKPVLTVIDYSKPSTAQRLWVFDMKNNKALFNTWVSHGKNSGGLNATSFSNGIGSLKSSFGLFVTQNSYFGGNGYSLRLKGLERGINDNAYARNVVVHGAWYANPDIIKQYGQLGRSWGCPAVSSDLARPLINTIKENTLVFVYYPDRKWLAQSRYLVA